MKTKSFPISGKKCLRNHFFIAEKQMSCDEKGYSENKKYQWDCFLVPPAPSCEDFFCCVPICVRRGALITVDPPAPPPFLPPSPSQLTTHSNSTPQRPRFNGSVEAFFNSDDPQRQSKWPPSSFWIYCFHNLTETFASKDGTKSVLSWEG